MLFFLPGLSKLLIPHCVCAFFPGSHASSHILQTCIWSKLVTFSLLYERMWTLVLLYLQPVDDMSTCSGCFLLVQLVDTPPNLSTGERNTKTCCVAVTQPWGQNEQHAVTATKLSPSAVDVHPPSRRVLESTLLKSSRMSTSCDVISQMNNWNVDEALSLPPSLETRTPTCGNRIHMVPCTLPPATLIALLSGLRVTGAYWEPRQGGVGVLHISPHTEYAFLTSWEAIRFSFAASPPASPSIIWWHLKLCASKCGLETPFGRWPLTNHLHVMAANVRHLLYIV